MEKSNRILLFIFIFFLSSCGVTDTSYDPFFWGEEELTLEVYSSGVDLTQLVTLHDAEDGELEVTNEMIEENINFNIVDTYLVIYRFTDSDGNSTSFNLTVNIVDTTIPGLSIIGDETIYVLQGDKYIEQGVNISDNYDINNIVIISGDLVDSNIVGKYEVKYNYSDSSDNQAIEINRTIIVYPNMGLDFIVGDEVHMSGFYTNSPEGSYLLANIGFFEVQAISLSGEYPIGLSLLSSDKITIWTKPEYLINRNSFVFGEVVLLEVPLQHQFDYIGNLNGSSLSISGYGCALTALTMIVNYYNNSLYTPEETNIDLVTGGLVYWVNTEIPKYGNIIPTYYPSYSQYRTEIPFSNELSYKLFQMHLKEKLDEGIPPIIKIKGNTTHYVVVIGYEYNENGDISFKINDPGSSYRFYLKDLLSRYQYFYEGFIYYND